MHNNEGLCSTKIVLSCPSSQQKPPSTHNTRGPKTKTKTHTQKKSRSTLACSCVRFLAVFGVFVFSRVFACAIPCGVRRVCVFARVRVFVFFFLCVLWDFSLRVFSVFVFFFVCVLCSVFRVCVFACSVACSRVRVCPRCSRVRGVRVCSCVRVLVCPLGFFSACVQKCVCVFFFFFFFVCSVFRVREHSEMFVFSRVFACIRVFAVFACSRCSRVFVCSRVCVFACLCVRVRSRVCVFF